MHEQIRALPLSFGGKFIFYCLPYRRSTILKNMDQVFGERLDLEDKKHLAKAFYSHLLACLKEVFCLPFLSDERLTAQVDVKGHEHLLTIVAEKRGVLVLTGHFGNWEFAPLGGILNFKAFQGHFHFIRKTFKSKWLEKLLFGRYQRRGLHVIPKKNALEQVSEALEKNHAVIFVLDQHASLKNRDGIAVEFFGKKAGTFRSLASFARHTGVPVVPAASYRLKNGRHQLVFYPPLMWTEYESTQASLYHNTLAYNQMLEKIILEHPEQWWWFHKRWKL